MKIWLYLFYYLFAVSSFCSDSVLYEISTGTGNSGWMLNNYNTQGSFAIVPGPEGDNGSICITLPDYKDKVCLKNKLTKTIPQGTLIKISCRYRTEAYSTAYPSASFLSFTYPEELKKKSSTRLYFTESEIWKPIETTFITSQESSPDASIVFNNCKGKIYILGLKIEILPASSDLRKDQAYILREAEDIEQRPGVKIKANTWNPDGSISYRGKGAVYCGKGGTQGDKFRWKFQIKENQLRNWHLWLLTYGFMERPVVTVKLDDNLMDKFRLEANEKKTVPEIM